MPPWEIESLLKAEVLNFSFSFIVLLPPKAANATFAF